MFKGPYPVVASTAATERRQIASGWPDGVFCRFVVLHGLKVPPPVMERIEAMRLNRRRRVVEQVYVSSSLCFIFDPIAKNFKADEPLSSPDIGSRRPKAPRTSGRRRGFHRLLYSLATYQIERSSVKSADAVQALPARATQLRRQNNLTAKPVTQNAKPSLGYLGAPVGQAPGI